MSLVDLPDNLIAKVASYLNYKDTCSLMETCKKNYNAVKDAAMDKLKLEEINFYVHENPIRFSTLEAGSRKKYQLKSVEAEDNNKFITTVLSKCDTIDRLWFTTKRNVERVVYDILSDDMINPLYETEAKIRSISAKYLQIDLPPERFVDFCCKFKGSSFIDCRFTERIWTDEVLTQVVRFTSMEYVAYLRDVIPYSAALMTDKTLRALIGCNKVQQDFVIKKMNNSFTVKQIVENLKIVRKRKVDTLNWYLGMLSADQFADAEKFFNPANNGELKDIYELSAHKGREYSVYNPGRAHSRFKVHFSVKIEEAEADNK